MKQFSRDGFGSRDSETPDSRAIDSLLFQSSHYCIAPAALPTTEELWILNTVLSIHSQVRNLQSEIFLDYSVYSPLTVLALTG